MRRLTKLVALPLALGIAATVAAVNDGGTIHQRIHEQKYASAAPDPEAPTERLVDVPCNGKKADVFPCKNMDLLSFVPMAEFYEDADDHIDTIGNLKLSEIWGWANPETGNEFVGVGAFNSVAFFNVTDPFNPLYLGKINTATPADLQWFDIKSYDNFAIITGEATPFGMLIFDWTRLEGLDQDHTRTFEPDALYGPNIAAHNVVVNEDTGFAYLVGSGTIAGALTSIPGTTAGTPYGTTVAAEACRGGLHAVDLNDPLLPVFAGCFATDGYVHDAQCVIYDGPDADYTGREICFAYNEDHVFIVDMTLKVAILEISSFTYDGASYTHQGWLTEDGRHLVFNDEGDEPGKNTTTYIADVSDLDNPVMVGEYDHGTTSIDHNNYILNGLAYQSNYTTGLRIMDLDGIETAELETIAFFDTFPSHDNAVFLGTWGNYPYLPSGNIVISGGAEGLFIVRLDEATRQFYEGPNGGTPVPPVLARNG